MRIEEGDTQGAKGRGREMEKMAGKAKGEGMREEIKGRKMR